MPVEIFLVVAILGAIGALIKVTRMIMKKPNDTEEQTLEDNKPKELTTY